MLPPGPCPRSVFSAGRSLIRREQETELRRTRPRAAPGVVAQRGDAAPGRVVAQVYVTLPRVAPTPVGVLVREQVLGAGPDLGVGVREAEGAKRVHELAEHVGVALADRLAQ